MSAILLRAEITIDLEAEDYAQAADHQQRIQSLAAAVLAHYQQAQVAFRPRRGPRPKRRRLEDMVQHRTGRAHDYD